VVEHRAEIEDVEIPAANSQASCGDRLVTRLESQDKVKSRGVLILLRPLRPAARIGPTETGVSEQY
jgi:hypothetical protein